MRQNGNMTERETKEVSHLEVSVLQRQITVISQYNRRAKGRMIMNDELKIMWNGTIVVCRNREKARVTQYI